MRISRRSNEYGANGLEGLNVGEHSNPLDLNSATSDSHDPLEQPLLNRIDENEVEEHDSDTHYKSTYEEDLLLDSSEDDSSEMDENRRASLNLTAVPRQGTISSARFNLLSTMVGGGALSMPSAFVKLGLVVGPLLLLIVAVVVEYTLRLMIHSTRTVARPSNNDTTGVGTFSYPQMAHAAFGEAGQKGSILLITVFCWLGTVGYGILLRDMLHPLLALVSSYYDNNPHDASQQDQQDSLSLEQDNMVLGLVILFMVTPLCSVRSFTSLQLVGAASFLAVVLLGVCITVRSIQANICQDGPIPNENTNPVELSWGPGRIQDVWDALPILIYCYVCHFNVLHIFNEFQEPTPARTSYWLRSSVGTATVFYIVVGFSGALYVQAKGRQVSGNILLDFEPNDSLLTVGRLCMAITLTIAIPMMMIQPRDMMLEYLSSKSLALFFCHGSSGYAHPSLDEGEILEGTLFEYDLILQEQQEQAWKGIPLFANQHSTVVTSDSTHTEEENTILVSVMGDNLLQEASSKDAEELEQTGWMKRLIAAIVLLWSATGVATCAQSIDIVWDVLGSSLAILLSILIPVSSYLAITSHSMTHASEDNINEEESNNGEREDVEREMGGNDFFHRFCSRVLAWTVLMTFVPIMTLCTIHSVHGIFSSNSE